MANVLVLGSCRVEDIIGLNRSDAKEFVTANLGDDIVAGGHGFCKLKTCKGSVDGSRRAFATPNAQSLGNCFVARVVAKISEFIPADRDDALFLAFVPQFATFAETNGPISCAGNCGICNRRFRRVLDDSKILSFNLFGRHVRSFPRATSPMPRQFVGVVRLSQIFHFG